MTSHILSVYNFPFSDRLMMTVLPLEEEHWHCNNKKICVCKWCLQMVLMLMSRFCFLNNDISIWCQCCVAWLSTWRGGGLQYCCLSLLTGVRVAEVRACVCGCVCVCVCSTECFGDNTTLVFSVLLLSGIQVGYW